MVDAILFGVILQLYIQWHTYSRKEDRKLVRWLVVSLGLFSSSLKSIMLPTPSWGFDRRWYPVKTLLPTLRCHKYRSLGEPGGLGGSRVWFWELY